MQASNISYSQKQTIFQKTFTKINSILKTLSFLDPRESIMRHITLAVEYEDMSQLRNNNGK